MLILRKSAARNFSEWPELNNVVSSLSMPLLRSRFLSHIKNHRCATQSRSLNGLRHLFNFIITFFQPLTGFFN